MFDCGRSAMPRWQALTVPTLEINGWYDRYRDGMVKNHRARPDDVRLVSGPSEHGYPEGQYAGIGKGACPAWWDHWLAQDPDAPLPAARVTSYEVPGPGAGAGWQKFDRWPPRDTRRTALRLTSNGSPTPVSEPSGVATFDVNTGTTPPADHEQLRFTTPPPHRGLVLAGDARARIRASFTAGDGNIAAVLHDRAPDGSTSRIAQGWLEANHRDAHTGLSPVEPGVYYDIDVRIRPMHYRLSAGHRLVLRISSDDHPRIASDAPAGQVGVKTGARGPTLQLTVRNTPPIFSH